MLEAALALHTRLVIDHPRSTLGVAALLIGLAGARFPNFCLDASRDSLSLETD